MSHYAEQQANTQNTYAGPEDSERTPEKPRSCTLCAQRKVKCDKKVPCNRCRSAGIPCTLPYTSSRPRWARRRVPSPGVGDPSQAQQPSTAPENDDLTLEKLRRLQGLLQDLTSELHEARSRSISGMIALTADVTETSSRTDSANTPKSGSRILDDSDNFRYVSGSFWSSLGNELDRLKGALLEQGTARNTSLEAPLMPTSSVISATAAPTDPPSNTNSLLFGAKFSSSGYAASTLLPLPSQMPFLLEIYLERVHSVICLPHMPSFRQRLQRLRRGTLEDLSLGEQALSFAVFYSAICSLEEDEATTSFQVPKDELSSNYRAGLEQSLAKADILDQPSEILVQSLVIYLALARRNESPKYVWMMTGLTIRMGHFLGLHHEQSDSGDTNHFQIEMQRRVWWNLCALDMRATEDQGTDLAIIAGSYSTRIPANVEECDIWPGMKQPPVESSTPTNTTLFRLCSKLSRRTQEMIAAGASISVTEHALRIAQMRQELEKEYFTQTDQSRHDAYLATTGFVRMAIARLKILAHLPVLFASPSEGFPAEVRTQLLIAAIEVIEHNHALNTNASCRPWRWIFQTQQQWHAVVYLLLEICRRSWDPIAERAWMAVQSPWLVPARAVTDKRFSSLVPIRRLMTRARGHRETEIARLRDDVDAVLTLERESEQQVVTPSSSLTFPEQFDHAFFQRHWRQLFHPVADSADTASGVVRSHAAHFEPYPNDSMYSEVCPSSQHPHIDQRGSAAPYSSTNPDPASAWWPSQPTAVSAGSDLLGYSGTSGGIELTTDSDFLNFDWDSWLQGTL